MNWDPVTPFWPPSSASSINRTVGFLAPPCCSQVPNRRSKRTQGNGTSWRSKKGQRIIAELSSSSVFPKLHRLTCHLQIWSCDSHNPFSKPQLDTREALLDTTLLELAWPTQAGADQRTNRQQILGPSKKSQRKPRALQEDFALPPLEGGKGPPNARHAGFPQIENPPTPVEFQRHPTVERCNLALTVSRT